MSNKEKLKKILNLIRYTDARKVKLKYLGKYDQETKILYTVLSKDLQEEALKCLQYK